MDDVRIILNRCHRKRQILWLEYTVLVVALVIVGILLYHQMI